jgi:hypothetical protein
MKMALKLPKWGEISCGMDVVWTALYRNYLGNSPPLHPTREQQLHFLQLAVEIYFVELISTNKILTFGAPNI